jgi:hypothetical protein
MLHAGIDIAMAIGTRVNAVMDGIVVFADNLGTAGWTVIIDHDNGFRTQYLHLQANGNIVSEGQRVIAGQHIANSGNTGAVASDGHLHFELINPSGNPINPLARYHTSSFRTTNPNPFFLENPIIVHDSDFCWDCAEGQNAYNATRFEAPFICVKCR